VKKSISVLAGLALAGCALAELNKYKDWDKSSDAYFLTPPERAEWKNVATDEDADRFIALYWAKRDPSPGTPQNEFRDEIGRRIAAADQQFKMTRYKRGSDSVRGRLLIVLGTPSRAAQQALSQGEAPIVAQEGGYLPPPDTGGGAEETLSIWTYDKEKLAPFGLPELRARIAIDQRRGLDTLQNSSEVEKDLAVVAQKSIVNPNATVVSAAAPAAGSVAGAPPAAAVPPGAAKPPAATAPAAGSAAAPAAGAAAAAGSAASAPPPGAPVAALPAAAKTALASIDPKTVSDAAFWSGVFRTPAGDPFLAFQFYLPSDKPSLAAPTLQFGGVVTNEAGEEVGSFWEPATLGEIAEGTRKDRVFEKSVPLPAGKYKGSFGLFPSEGQAPVAAASVSFELPAKTSEFSVSPLLLASGIVPMTRRPGPTEPFVFGVDKPMKVEPKGNRQFTKQDTLLYFFALSNPVVPPPAADAAPDAPAPRPRIMTRINVKLDGKDAFAPFSAPAELQDVSAGYYVGGTEVPLASFEPGYYTFLINLRDLNAPPGSAANKGIDRKEDFIVLMPDGSVPAPKKAAAPAPAPAKKKPS
jgi:GWxTD domain-containing protein